MSPLTSAPELGVYESSTAMPCCSKKPWRCAAQSGRFQPPAKATTRTVVRLSGCGCARAIAHAAHARASSTRMRSRFIVASSLGVDPMREQEAFNDRIDRRRVGHRAHVAELGELDDLDARQPRREQLR